jgi:hypothetical protein
MFTTILGFLMFLLKFRKLRSALPQTAGAHWHTHGY